MSNLTKNVRLHRLVQILSIGKHYTTAKELAKSLHVTERTVYRDLIDLDLLGYSVYNDRGYKLLKPTPKPSIPFTSEDFSTLKHILDASPLIRLPNMKDRSLLLLSKLQTVLCVEADRDNRQHSIEATEPDPPKRIHFSLGTLEKAINRQRAVSILYHSLDELQPTRRVIHPYTITIRSGYWYLIAFAPERQDFRQYRLERIQELSPLKDAFERDPSFNLHDYFHQSMKVFKGEPIRVTIRLRGKAARLASERSWPDETVLEWLPSGEAILQVTIQGTQEILAWTLSRGDEAEILEPPSLREQIQIAIERMRRLYKED